MIDFLMLPDGTKLIDGNIVTIEEYADTKWVVHNGWHVYANKYYKGWYFSSIPNKQIQPQNTVDLSTVHIISNSVDSTGLQYPLNVDSIEPDNSSDDDPWDDHVDTRYSFRLEDGNIVILRDDPEKKWILRYGWYNFDLKQYQGWYFVSIADKTIRPVNPEDMKNIVPVSTVHDGLGQEAPALHVPITATSNDSDSDSDEDEFIPSWWQPWPGPPGPWPGPHNPLFPPVAADPELTPYQVKASFVSVPDITARNNLNDGKLPDGKLVRVNDVDGEIEYYAWSKQLQDWVDVNFVFEERTVIAGDGLKGGGDLSDDVTLHHGDTGTGEDHTYTPASQGVPVIDGILVDKFGHTVGVSDRDLTVEIQQVVEEDTTIAKVSQLPRWTVIDPDSDSEQP